jgi:hypothetical protein
MKGSAYDNTKPKRKAIKTKPKAEQEKPTEQPSIAKSEAQVENDKDTSTGEGVTNVEPLARADDKKPEALVKPDQIIEINKSEEQFNETDLSINNKVQSDETSRNGEYVNPRGVRFVQDTSNNNPAIPYGLPCIRELLRFLISLINT